MTRLQTALSFAPLWLALASGGALAQQATATGAALAPLAGGSFPQPRLLELTLVPAGSRYEVLRSGSFPSSQAWSLTLLPTGSPYTALGTGSFPKPRMLSVTLVPASVTAQGVPPKPPSAGATAHAAAQRPDAEALASVATASFPAPQPLSVTLAPPATPLAEIAGAALPVPQPLSVTLLPPATALAAIAAAKFPDPAPLSVMLQEGELLVAATTFAGLTSGLFLGPQEFTVQIVQVIPRRGANFFDHRDPTGAATVLVAGATAQQPGLAPVGAPAPGPVTSGVGVWICDTIVWVDGHGVPYMNSAPPPVPALRVTGGNGANASAQLLPPWDPVPGTNPTFSGGTFNFPGEIGSAQFAAGCPGANPGDNRWSNNLRTVEEVTLTPLPHVCVRRLAGGLFNPIGCNAQGN